MAEQSQKAVANVIDKLTQLNSNNYPCKKTVQKMVYLIEEAGEDLGFEYSIHFYGPYSAELDYEIQELSARGILEIKYTKHGHLLSVPQSSTGIRTGETAKRIINAFGRETPSSLELLATTLFVQRETHADEKEPIISGVKKIKGSKYSEQRINEAISNLRQNNFFVC